VSSGRPRRWLSRRSHTLSWLDEQTSSDTTTRCCRGQGGSNAKPAAMSAARAHRLKPRTLAQVMGTPGRNRCSPSASHMVSDQILTHVCPITFRAGGRRGGGADSNSWRTRGARRRRRTSKLRSDTGRWRYTWRHRVRSFAEPERIALFLGEPKRGALSHRVAPPSPQQIYKRNHSDMALVEAPKSRYPSRALCAVTGTAARCAQCDVCMCSYSVLT